ncbi:MAG: pyruvate kinase [Omnitrophica WOR_2 bacterium]
MERCAKIVATIGPASHDEEVIRSLILAGMGIARLNFSHGTHDNHAAVITRLRKVEQELEKPVCILQDLQGPKIRTEDLENGSIELKPGQPLTLTTKPMLGNSQVVAVDYPDLPRSVQPGGRILLDDGNMELAVVSTGQDQVETRVITGGVLKPHKGVNLPGAHMDIPCFTEKDQEDLAFGLKQGVDAIAMSFVKNAGDISRVRNAITRMAPERENIPIIAKLERPEALENLEEIIDIADGVMVARGDLGVEMSPEVVPIAQKRIIESANRHAKVVITATQMLESMIHNPRPTRAEASDVANAIFDGTDAVMLSGETASGEYPVKAVEMMDAIVREAEANMEDWGHWKGNEPSNTEQDDTYFMTRAACELAYDRNVAAVAIFTKSGRTALLMSKTRPKVPILGFTPDPYTYRRMNLYWGARPYLVPQENTIRAMLADVEAAMVRTTPIQPGQQVILICGFPVDEIRPTNMALLHTVGQYL